MKRGIKSGSITPNSSLLKFSDDALDEQKHALRIADEKVALATQAYDLVSMEVSLTRVMIECNLVSCPCGLLSHSSALVRFINKFSDMLLTCWIYVWLSFFCFNKWICRENVRGI